jgi:hypothetical protein
LIVTTSVPRPITKFAPTTVLHGGHAACVFGKRVKQPTDNTTSRCFAIAADASFIRLLRKWRPVVIGPGAPSRQASGPTTIARNRWISGQTSHSHHSRHSCRTDHSLRTRRNHRSQRSRDSTHRRPHSHSTSRTRSSRENTTGNRTCDSNRGPNQSRRSPLASPLAALQKRPLSMITPPASLGVRIMGIVVRAPESGKPSM